MHLTKENIIELEKIKRLNIINSVTGIKPANLIGSISEENGPNLAIFSSVVHLGSSPAILGFVLRPRQGVRRHTYENILETGYYTINHIHQSFVENAHYTSAKFDQHISEFEACGVTQVFKVDFPAPFVKESQLQIGMRYLQSVPIEVNQTMIIIGEIVHLIFPDHIMDGHGHLDLCQINDVGISGLNSYYSIEKIGQFPYARPGELPLFTNNEPE